MFCHRYQVIKWVQEDQVMVSIEIKERLEYIEMVFKYESCESPKRIVRKGEQYRTFDEDNDEEKSEEEHRTKETSQ